MELSWSSVINYVTRDFIDIGIVIILLISVAIAVFRGFVKEATSLASWVVAIWLAITFSNQAALFLPVRIGTKFEASLPKVLSFASTKSQH